MIKTPDDLKRLLSAQPWPRCMMCRGPVRASGLFKVVSGTDVSFQLLCAEHGFNPVGKGWKRIPPKVTLIKSLATKFHPPTTAPEDATYNALARKVIAAMKAKGLKR